MKSKKIVALMTSAVLFSQLLYVNPTIINAQVADTSLEATDPSQEATNTSSEATNTSQEATDPSQEETNTSSEATNTSSEATNTSSEATNTSQEATNSSQEATDNSSEIEDKCDTGETIKKEYPNSVKFQGIGCQTGIPHGFTLEFDPQNMKLKTTNIHCGSDSIHYYFHGKKYIEIKLVGRNGKVKKTFTLNGDNHTDEVKKLNEWDFKYGEYLQFYHAEADWRTTISGDVICKTSGTNYSKSIGKNILEENMFQITRKGLKQVPLYKNKIDFQGIGCQTGIPHGFTLNMDTTTMKLKVTNIRCGYDSIHYYFPGKKYIEIELIDENGNVKNSFKLNGDEHTDKAEQLNEWNFKYGDYLKLYHAEADWRTTISGKVKNATCGTNYAKSVSKDILEHNMFKITRNGLKQVKIYQNEIKFQGIGCQSGIPHGFTLKLNTDTKKLEATNINCGYDQIHHYFPSTPYITIKLISRYGNVKHSFIYTGNDPVDKVKELNKYSFEYGDYLQIYHAEADWRTTISGTVEGATPGTHYDQRVSKDILEHNMFKITKNGLKQVKIYQNEISLSGAKDEQGKTPSFKLKFDTDAMRIRVTDLVNPCSKLNNTYSGADYICLTLIGENGVHKKRVVLNGDSRAIKALCFSGVRFEYGDKIRIYHAQTSCKSNKFTISGNVIDGKGSSVDLSAGVPQNVMHRYDFKITEDGLEEVPYVE